VTRSREITSLLASFVILLTIGVASADVPISSRPTFDCEKAKSPLALLICSGEETARADWDFKIAHYARNFSLDEADRAAFWKDQDKWSKSLDKTCRLSGGPPFSQKQKSCVIDAYRKRAALYRSKLSGDALAESKLTPEQLLQIQQGLITLGFFNGEADGEFGPRTRVAIKKYQEAKGLPQSGFLSMEQRQALLEGRTASVGSSNAGVPSQGTSPQSSPPRADATNVIEMTMKDSGGCGPLVFSKAASIAATIEHRLNDRYVGPELRLSRATKEVLFGKYIVQWTDDDIETAVRVYRGCDVKAREEAIRKCQRSGGPGYNTRDYCESRLSNALTGYPADRFRAEVVNAVSLVRNAIAQQKAKEDAQIAIARQQAQEASERAEREHQEALARAEQQAREASERAEREDREASERAEQQAQIKRERDKQEAQREEARLREQAKRDREAAEAARQLAETEGPKIAEAAKEAAEARRAREEAEQRLAQIRGQIEAQDRTRNEALAQARAADAARQAAAAPAPPLQAPSAPLPQAAPASRPQAATGVKTTGHVEFHNMLADTGCDSRYSREKQADLFASRYKGQRMTVTGEVASANKGKVGIRMLPSTLTSDITVGLRNPQATYDLNIGQRIRLSFTVSSHGGCLLPFGGSDGVIEGRAGV